MATALKKKKAPKDDGVLLADFKPVKQHPLPKFKKATKAQVEKSLALYEEWLDMQRDGRVVFEPGDAVEWIREDRTKDYNS